MKAQDSTFIRNGWKFRAKVEQSAFSEKKAEMSFNQGSSNQDGFRSGIEIVKNSHGYIRIGIWSLSRNDSVLEKSDEIPVEHIPMLIEYLKECMEESDYVKIEK